ncbi:D-2-hydroxyacid dehydrogenase [Metabacillus litoralis]|uniref:D-2-hydroxyacid dehydrogenase n=1 Tax=Metabacillus litoralis TaxID=152268 RepID=A0A5C6VKP8_9BACI|nr:D-2-hydroxyacid dehydrogenase [Metabacillus litoralis]TXC85847.1 D-2-hydroxyacid dehydrogenase [Metabacillus litoralis]
MMKRKLVITQNLNEHLLHKVIDILPDWTIITGSDSSIWEPHLKDAEIIAGWKKQMEEIILKEDINLKWLQTWSAGVNKVPLDYFHVKKIHLTSANGVHGYPISETIFAYMLSFTRKLHTYVRQQTQQTWHHANMNQELHEKTVGIIGVGHIGRETAKIAKAFRMKVLGIRNSGEQEEFVDEMYTSSDLHKILPQCDFVIVTLPLTPETKGLFGKEEFELMKSSSIFINIGRGAIVKETELIEALESKQIAGAGLDVFEIEPLPKESPLWKMENVIITPHTSGSTEYYNQRVLENIFIPNLQDYLNGKQPSVNLLNFDKGY